MNPIAVIIVIVLVLIVLYMMRNRGLFDMAPATSATTSAEPAPVTSTATSPEPVLVVQSPTTTAEHARSRPLSEVAAKLAQTQRNVLKGDYEIEDRAQLEQAEYYGYANYERASTPGDVGDVYAFNPDDVGRITGSNDVGPEPQDYMQAIKRIGLEPGVIENHALWVQDQMKFSNAYATKTSGRNQDTSDLFEGAVPFQGLRRPQAVPIYGLRAEVDDTPKGRIFGNKKFVFTY